MQTSIKSFFSRTPKAKPGGGNGDTSSPLGERKAPNTPSSSSSSSQTPSSTKGRTQSGIELRFPEGSLVWAKLVGYPWWPSLVCKHPTQGRAYRKEEVHVQFFDTPVTRSWVGEKMVRPYEEKFIQGPEATDDNWKKGCGDAEKAKDLSCEERLENFLVPHLPSDEEWDDEEEEVSPGSKENKPAAAKEGKEGEPSRKRRRIIMMDSDDSGDDTTFQPKKEDLEDDDEEDEVASDEVEESEPETDSENESPVKSGAKRKRGTDTKKKILSKPLSTPVSKFAKKNSSAPSTPQTPGLTAMSPSIFGAGKTPAAASVSVNESTKMKLAMFGAAGATVDEEGETKTFGHTNLEFLKPENIKDKERRPRSHPDYNPRTLHVPEAYLRQLTPAQKQWWELKADYYDVILFFKMGKFYELFHMDADVGVAELNLVYMRGEVAHSGFPEIAYSRYASTLVEKGYKVARIEQTETPAMMEERVKKMARPKKFDKVVEREVCQLSTKGTRVNNFLDSNNFEGEPRYLTAIYETTGKASSFGVAFVDTTIGVFHLGQFTDDKNLSRLRTLTAHYPPAEILYEKGGLSSATGGFLASSLPGVRREGLKAGSEFWDSAKTLKILAEEDYFKNEEKRLVWPETLQGFQDPSDTLGLTANSGTGDLAIRSLGALVWYLKQGFLDQELLSLKKFEVYNPVDSAEGSLPQLPQDSTKTRPVGKYMVLDGITIRNLELVSNGTGTGDGTLIARMDNCLTPMGKRTLRHWLVSPLLQASSIKLRQKAVEELMAFPEISDLKTQLKKIPDLERLLSKIHTAGDAHRSRSHPDSRAVMFENNVYSKRKIMDLLTCLDGFKRTREILGLFQGAEFESKILKNIVRLEGEGGEFPDLTEVLAYFDNGFDHSSARKEGKIIPSKGVDPELDEADANLSSLQSELADYLKEQKRHFGCDVKYWGTGKNRFQLEVPVEKVKKAGDEYELASGTKKLKRYVTDETKDFLQRQMELEACKEKALNDIQRKMFAQFSKHADAWRKAIGCICLLDSLLSLAIYSSGLETSCFPQVVDEDANLPIDIKEGRHPCLDIEGDSYIPNDTYIAKEKSLIILTGPNMGGKSTLMRQTGLLVVLAQLGSMVPATAMSLSPVDRIFTRLGAQDNIVGGESTFLVELQETSTILQHASPHSLVLIDELGRGTATYDGTAIAGAVVSSLAKRGCRTLFATHYHNLALEERSNVTSSHMACMVENEGHEDITQESITFLYKLVDGPCPKSHGFNAAKLAGLPDEIVRRGFVKAKEFEANERKKNVG